MSAADILSIALSFVGGIVLGGAVVATAATVVLGGLWVARNMKGSAQ